MKLIGNKDVQEILHVSASKASSVIKQLQSEMEKQGYLVIKGRIPEEYLRKRFMLEDEQEETKGGKKK